MTDTHTTASVCAPSRAGLLSGRYQQRFGFECNSPNGKDGMHGEVVTYAEAMKQAGYQTFGLGKWHLGYQAEMHPNRQGFDHFSGFLGGGRSYWPIEHPKSGNMMQRDGKQVPEKEITYVTDWLTDEAKRLIEHREPGKPFFMYLSYNAPHTPMHATKGHDVLYFRRAVAAGLRDGSWKLIRVEKKDKSYRYLIFDLSSDIGETKNLAEQHPERVEQLAAKLAAWEEDLQPPDWREGDYWEKNQRLKHRMEVIGRDAERRLP